MRISSRGLDLIKSFESFVPYVYDDLVPPKGGKYAEWQGPSVRGTLTIGYGHTNAAKHPLRITKGLRITEAEALNILDVDLDECEAAVNKAITRPLTQGQYDALVSFTFNCGSGSLANIAMRFNIGNVQAARNALLLYNKSKGVELAGLTRRRKAEQALWDADYQAPLPTEPVHHPAAVDAETWPGATPKPPPPPVAVPAAVAGGSVIAGFAAIMADNPAILIIGVVLVLIAAVAFIIWKSRKD